MTLNEIINSDSPLLTAKDVAEILECNPQSLRKQAKENPDALGFSIMMIGNTIKIPRIPFLQRLGIDVKDR